MEYKGESGYAYWQTIQFDGLRIRLVEYSPGYITDHWCMKGHIVHCLEGEFISELHDGNEFLLTKESIVKEWLKANNKKISIREIWANWKIYPEELTYPLSGLFVKELIDNFGNQTYENAKSVFGDKLNVVIRDFEDKINS